MAGQNLTHNQPAVDYNSSYDSSHTISRDDHDLAAANLSGDPQELHLAASIAIANTASAVAATLTSGSFDDVTGATVTMLAPLMFVDYNVTTVGRGAVMLAKKNHTVMTSCVMFGTGVLGNLLALFVLATSSVEQRRTLFYKLVAGLAITDLLGTVATSPVVIAVYVNNFQWVGGMAMCHYFSFAMIFAGYATMLIVCTMSVERYICVRHPYIYHTRFSGKFAKLALLACWAFSVGIASLPLLGVGNNVKQFPQTWCFFDYLSTRPADVAFNYIYAIIALIVVIVTFVCNVSVIVTLLTLRSRQNRLDASEAPGRRRNRATSQRFAEIQMMLMLIGVTVVFTACFAPLMIFVLICQTDIANYIDSKTSVLTLIRVASFNPILDPWVYILFRRELVWRIVRLCRCILRLEPLLPLSQQRLLQKEHGNAGGQGGKVGENGEVGNGKCRRKPWDDPYDPSCLTFCYQCLCLPPAPRTSIIMSQSRGQSVTMGRSPSQGFRRNSSSEQMTTMTSRSPTRTPIRSPNRTPTRLVMTPPSPAEQLLLKKLSYLNGSAKSVHSNV